MSKNLFEYGSQSFRLYDVEGVVLDDPMDYIVVHEPVNFGDTQIYLTRDPKTHGFSYEFSDSETPFGFDHVLFTGQSTNPYDLLLAIYNAKGVDGKVLLEFRNETETPIVQYQANLAFEMISITDSLIEMPGRRVNFDDKFRTRIDVPVSFDATESIDGDSITGITPESVFLHSKVIRHTQHAYMRDTYHGDAFTVGINPMPSGTTHFVQIVHNQEFRGANMEIMIDDYSNEVFSLFGNRNKTEIVNELSPSYTAKDAGSLHIIYDANYVIDLDGSGTGTHLGAFVMVNDVEYEMYAGVGDITSPTPIVFSFDNYVEVPKDAIIYFYDKITTDGTTATYEVYPSFVTEHSFTLIFDTVSESSLCDAYTPIDSFNHVLESYIGETGIFESDFFTTEANEIYKTNGYKIRNVPDQPVYASFEDLYENWALPMFGLGYQIYNDSGTFKMVMERYSFFYRDVEIDYIEDIVEGSFEITPDEEIFFNEAKIGYKEFPKSTDENTKNNVDDFNSQHNLLLPIKSVKNKVDFISESIGSGYKIENQRREQFNIKPKDTVSDDEKLFCIKCINSDTYVIEAISPFYTILTDDDAYTVKLYGCYFDIRIGDVIIPTYAGSSYPDGESFTIQSVLISGVYTIFEVDYVAASTAGAGEFTITIDSSRRRAERDENMDVLTGVTSPETVYNVGLNPKNMLLNQSPILLSGLSRKAPSEEIKTQRVFLNSEMAFQFSSGEGGYVLGAGTEIAMSDNLALSEINGFDRLFTGDKIRFRAHISYSRLLSIKSSHLLEDGSTDLGYLRVNVSGVDWKFFLLNLTYNPLQSEAEFVGRVKYTAGSS